MTFSLRFWGVRGSTPTPGPGTLLYGGHTTCFEVRVGGHLLIIDCGSGARLLGEALLKETSIRSFRIYLTHTHLDHICGLPFFAPAYSPAFTIKCFAGHLPHKNTLEQVINRAFSPPLFPLCVHHLTALSFHKYKKLQKIPAPEGVRVDAVCLNHPGGARGYAISYAGKKLCIITDHEHGVPEIDKAVTQFVSDADVLVYDGMYRDETYKLFRGHGHSTWEQGVALARSAHVKFLYITHHAPECCDAQLSGLDKIIAHRHPGACFAREGMQHVL